MGFMNIFKSKKHSDDPLEHDTTPEIIDDFAIVTPVEYAPEPEGENNATGT